MHPKFNSNTPEVKAVLDEGNGRKVFTTGRLEKAVASGHRVVVATTRDELSSHDQWWVNVVGRENVFLKDSVLAESLMDDESLPYTHAKDLENSTGWMNAFKHLGIGWPTRGECGCGRDKNLPAHHMDVIRLMESDGISGCVLGKKEFPDDSSQPK